MTFFFFVYSLLNTCMLCNVLYYCIPVKVNVVMKTSEYFEGKHNSVRSKDHVVKTRNCIAMK